MRTSYTARARVRIVKVVVNPLRVLRTGFPGVASPPSTQGCQRFFLLHARAKSKDMRAVNASVFYYVCNCFFLLTTLRLLLLHDYTLFITVYGDKKTFIFKNSIVVYSPNSLGHCSWLARASYAVLLRSKCIFWVSRKTVTRFFYAVKLGEKERYVFSRWNIVILEKLLPGQLVFVRDEKHYFRRRIRQQVYDSNNRLDNAVFKVF